MENTAQNTTHNLENEGLFRRVVTLRELIFKALKYWYWFFISGFVFVCLGALYILSTSPIYHREATVLIKDVRKGSAASELSAFADIAGISTRRSVDNELYVLQSRRLMLEVVNRLGLTDTYAIESRLRTNILYKNSPIKATYIDDLGGKGCSFRALLSEEGVTIREFSCSRKPNEKAEAKLDKEFTTSGKYGEVINIPIGQIVYTLLRRGVRWQGDYRFEEHQGGYRNRLSQQDADFRSKQDGFDYQPLAQRCCATAC